MPTYNTLIVLAGTALLGMNAGLVGALSVLRGRALLGDVLSHAALPGLCAAFLVLRERNLSVMLVGALASGIASVAVLAFLRRATRIKNDAAMGAARCVMFGLGIVLISYVQNAVASGSKAGLDSYILGKTAGMLAGDVAWLTGVSVFSLVVVMLLYKELRLASFDADFARVQGWPASTLDLLQMTLVGVTTVVGLPAVGAVMIAALLILPAAAMRFWTERFATLLIASMLLGGVIGVVGTTASAHYSALPAGPIIILTGTAFFGFSMFCAPRRGWTARFLAERRYAAALHERNLLLAMYAAESRSTADEGDRPRTMPVLGVDRFDSRRSRSIARAERAGFVERRNANGAVGSSCRLTDAGRRRAATLLRNERLWSAYVAENPAEANAPFDPTRSQPEDLIPPETLRRLEANLGDLDSGDGPIARSSNGRPE